MHARRCDLRKRTHDVINHACDTILGALSRLAQRGKKSERARVNVADGPGRKKKLRRYKINYGAAITRALSLACAPKATVSPFELFLEL